MIYSPDGTEVRLRLGPYRLGQSVTMACEVLGGYPRPEVTWWRDSETADDISEEVSEYKVTNLLTMTNLTRADQDSILTCQAQNNKNILPVTTSVKLDMICK